MLEKQSVRNEDGATVLESDSYQESAFHFTASINSVGFVQTVLLNEDLSGFRTFFGVL